VAFPPLMLNATQGHQDGYEDDLTRLKQACGHFEAAGLDQAILDAMIK
jgi:hypothetical protein